MTRTIRIAKVVIGANYGDEGKGLATDALCAAAARPVVVRFNGGAQAGHTVTTPDGRRHVFSHFGSGTFAGAPTFLSRYFAVLPRIFVRELAELEAMGERPVVVCDPAAQVTTPFDVGINRAVEQARGGGRHGSVGVGFGETVERAENGFGLTVADLADLPSVRGTLGRIAGEWLPRRLARLGLQADDATVGLVASASEIEAWFAEVAAMTARMTVAPIDAATEGREIVFEGAQGLLLDMDRGHEFPYVTRSNTGLKNALSLAADAGLDRLDVIYMTRAYLTRHGAGPLRNEVAGLDFADVVDPTNAPNPWQGAIRYAPLDTDVLRAAVVADLSDAAGSGIAVSAGVGVSCIDQIRGRGDLVVAGKGLSLRADDMVHRIGEEVRLPVVLESRGPTRERVMRPAARRLAA